MMDGKSCSHSILEECKKLAKNLPSPPKIHFILVGEDSASHIYVKRKQKTCQKMGFLSEVSYFEKTVSEEVVLQKIEEINQDPKTHALLVQMPLPPHINAEAIVERITFEKDVDGFHPMNMGRLLRGNKEAIVPCTPLGIQFLLKHYKVDLIKKRVLILGRSNVVGKPLSALLLQKNSKANGTITVAHSMTPELEKLTLNADILISCMGKAHFIKESMVKKGAVIIDVGINRLDLDGKSSLVGDVDYEKVSKKASLITPVPGGVGPMTIAMLMKNTLFCYEMQQKKGKQNH